MGPPIRLQYCDEFHQLNNRLTRNLSCGGTVILGIYPAGIRPTVRACLSAHTQMLRSLGISHRYTYSMVCTQRRVTYLPVSPNNPISRNRNGRSSFLNSAMRPPWHAYLLIGRQTSRARAYCELTMRPPLRHS